METEFQRSMSRATVNCSLLFAAIAISLRPLISGMAAGLSTNALIGAVLAFSVFFWLVHMALVGVVHVNRTAFLPLFVLLATMALSIHTSDHKSSSVLSFLHWLVFAGIFVTCGSLSKQPRTRQLFLACLLASTAVVAANGIHQRYWGLSHIREVIDADPEAVLRNLGLSNDRMKDFTARTYHRVFSTFLQPNALAGYLAMMLPVGIGAFCRHAGIHRKRRSASVFLLVLWTATILVCLGFTGSKGGSIATTIGLIAYMALCLRKWLLRHWRFTAAICVVIALLICAVGITYLRQSSGSEPDSFHVRLGYWKAAGKMIRQHPFRGVGLGNFGNHYTQHKSITAQETQFAHNDYLQLGAELGVIGLGVFICFWLSFFRCALSARPEEQHESGNSDRKQTASTTLLGIAGGILAFLIIGLVIKPYWASDPEKGTSQLTLIFFAIWVVVFLLVVRMKANWNAVRFGAVAGVIALLFHCSLDYDLYEYGIPQSLFLVAAMAISSSENARTWHFRLTPIPRTILLLGTIGCLLALFGFLFPSIVKTDMQMAIANNLSDKSFPSPGSVDRESFREAIATYQDAARSFPYLDRPYYNIGNLYVSLWRTDNRAGTELLQLANSAFQKAIERNSANSSIHYHVGLVWYDAARNSPDSLNEVLKHSSYSQTTYEIPSLSRKYAPAITEFREAVRLYPTSARHRYMLGISYSSAGMNDQAQTELLHALRMHSAAPMPQMKLKADELTRIDLLIDNPVQDK